MYHCAVQGWPTCTGPDPLATRPAVQGCPTWTRLSELVPELTPGLAAELAASVSDDGALRVAQPAVSTSSAAEAANHQFFINHEFFIRHLSMESNTATVLHPPVRASADILRATSLSN